MYNYGRRGQCTANILLRQIMLLSPDCSGSATDIELAAGKGNNLDQSTIIEVS